MSNLVGRGDGGLTDDALTERPRSYTVRRYLRQATDRLAGADPGLTQLRTALQAILGIVLAVALIYVFVKTTGALQLAPGSAPPAVVSSTNHALLIVAMLVGGILAMMAGFAVNDPSPRAQLVSTLLLPVPALAALAAGLAIGPYRIPSLIYLVVIMSLSVYVRRWGPRGFAGGLVAFQGGFLGFFLHKELTFGDLGWLAADVAIGIAASLIVRFVLLRPDPERTLQRIRRSWTARAGQLLELSSLLLEEPGPRHRDRRSRDALHQDRRQEQLRRQVVRLNESTLIVEAQLVVTSPTSARLEAQELFTAELSVTNCARFAGALARLSGPADAPLRDVAAAALIAAASEDWPAAAERASALRSYSGSNDRVVTLAHRLATSVEQYAQSRERLHRAIEARRRGDEVATFTPAVQLMNGYLPGSAPVSTAASTTPGRNRFERTTLPPYLRATIQIAVASTLAVIIGDAVDGFRLYWAVLAAFLAFMATTNTGEQVRKALFRVAGTAIGIVTGDLLVRATGGNIWAALPIVLVVLFLGIYLIRVNYTFMVIGITMMLSLIYYQLGEFSWSLLVLRLGETAVGVGAVVLTVLVVLPLRPQRVLTAGILLWFRSLADVLDLALDALLGADQPDLRRTARQRIRALDASWAALEATAQPLRHATFGRKSAQLAEIRAVSSAARFYARSLVDTVASLDVAAVSAVGVGGALRPAARDLRASVAAIDARIETGELGAYTRAAALVEHAVRELPPATVRDGEPAVDDTAALDDADALRLAMRDLTLLDAALARLAGALDMPVRDHDTEGEADAGRHLAPQTELA